MHESMSIMSGTDWGAKTESPVIESLATLDGSIAKAEDIVAQLLRRLEIVLQAEAPTNEAADAAMKDPREKSLLLRRIDEANRSVQGLTRRLAVAIDRLDI